MVIAVDFDGTCVTHEFPKVGKDVGAVPILKTLVEQGHKIILYTMRDDGMKAFETREGKTYYGNVLEDAVNWFKENNIPLYGINENPKQRYWTESPKVFADIYIDDMALGAPLKTSKLSDRPYIDWNKVKEILL